MDKGAWKGSPHAHGGGYQLDTTYQPPIGLEHTYTPPAANDNPFASDNPFGGSASAPEVVPAVEYSTYTAHPSVPAAAPVLQFQDSHLPTHSTTGKMGAAEVPRVQPYSGNQPLLQATHPPLSAPSPDADGENGTKYSMFNLKRYRKYFNVDTEDVLSRMLDSVVGFFRADFLEKTTDSADLYGPFWIATTLVFVGAVTGNYANYVSYKAKHSQQPDAELPTWYYNVDKVGYSAALFYGYVGVIGLLLFASLKWLFKSTVSLAQVWCTYGYSLSLFIPISFFCIFPYEVARWVLVMAATLTSGLFLMLNFRQPIFDVAGAKALPVWLLQGVLHLGLGLVLKLYFFQYW